MLSPGTASVAASDSQRRAAAKGEKNALRIFVRLLKKRMKIADRRAKLSQSGVLWGGMLTPGRTDGRADHAAGSNPAGDLMVQPRAEQEKPK
jgi:hypothetical protein